MSQTDLSGFQKRLVNFWVQTRTSFTYLWFFVGFCLVWVVCNKSQLIPTSWHWDNTDLTYLNLLLSIMAEVSSITILIYTLRLSEQSDRAEQKLINDIIDIKNSINKP